VIRFSFEGKMKGKLLNRDDGRPYGFLACGVSFRRLCKSISQCPGVALMSKRLFFWSGEDVHATFTFNGHEFKIDPDSWDDALWVIPKQDDATHPEIQNLFSFVEKQLGTPVSTSR